MWMMDPSIDQEVNKMKHPPVVIVSPSVFNQEQNKGKKKQILPSLCHAEGLQPSAARHTVASSLTSPAMLPGDSIRSSPRASRPTERRVNSRAAPKYLKSHDSCHKQSVMEI